MMLAACKQQIAGCTELVQGQIFRLRTHRGFAVDGEGSPRRTPADCAPEGRQQQVGAGCASTTSIDRWNRSTRAKPSIISPSARSRPICYFPQSIASTSGALGPLSRLHRPRHPPGAFARSCARRRGAAINWRVRLRLRTWRRAQEHPAPGSTPRRSPSAAKGWRAFPQK